VASASRGGRYFVFVGLVLAVIGLAISLQTKPNSRPHADTDEQAKHDEFRRTHPSWSDVVAGDAVLQSLIDEFPDLAHGIRNHDELAGQQIHLLFSAGKSNLTLREMNHFEEVWLYQGAPH